MTGTSVGNIRSVSRSMVDAIDGGGIGETFLRIPKTAKNISDTNSETEPTSG